MSRQLHWRQQPSQASLPAIPQISTSAQASQNDAASLIPKVQDVAASLAAFASRQYEAEQTRAVEDALLKTSTAFEQWKAGYMQQNQGQLAASAGSDFEAKWDELASQAREDFAGKSHEVFGDLLDKRLSERSLYALKDGIAFQQAQTSAFRQSQEQAQAEQLIRFAGANPDASASISHELASWSASMQARHPGIDLGKQQAQMAEAVTASRLDALLLKGDTAAARQLLASNPARPLGYATAHEENGGAGISAIGWDSTGGTSYGTWQLSSRRGSYQEWLAHLTTYGEQGKAIAKELAAAGPPDTGSKSGPAVQTYRRLASQFPQLFEQSQREYLLASHYQPALSRLPAALQEQIASDPSLSEMLFSTSVQHRGAGAARILNKAWHEGQSREDLIRSVYQLRAGDFPSSTRQVQKAVSERFAREADLIANMQPALSPARQQHYLNRIEAIERQATATNNAALRMAINNFVASSEDGNILDIPVTQAEVLSAFGDVEGPQIWQRITGSQKLAIALNHAKALPAAAQNELLAAAQPAPDSPTYQEEARHYEALSRAITFLQKSMAADPAAYAASVNLNFSEARQNLFRNFSPQSAAAYLQNLDAAFECLNLEGPPLAREDATRLARWLTQSSDPASAMQNLASAFGQATPRIMQAIAPDLSPSLLLAANMQSAPARILLAAEQDKEFDQKARVILEGKGSYPKDLDEAISDKLAPVLDSFGGHPDSRYPPAITQATRKLAIHYMAALGMSESEAISRAASEVILDRVQLIPGSKISTGIFSSQRRPALRLPKSEDAGAIEAGLSAWIDNARPEDFALLLPPGLDPNLTKDQLRSLLRQSAHWLTSPDESGATLMLGDSPVMAATGKPVTLSWQELTSLGRNQAAALEQQTRTAASAGMYALP